uniref:Uncharacterized protein n=1 Tax=Pyxicephalus adspersus TaxID=30357 RepID=A0AAV2ZYV1_PYXAD|nr:TPA: hypothetical protein GDO54_003975 [Pyxicephalus adspersus]
MDLVLNAADHYFFTPYIYPASWPEDESIRQIISLLIVTNLGGFIIYLLFGALSYYFVFDHSLMKHPQFLKNQVRREIIFSLKSMPWMSVPTVALFFAEVRGYSRLYDNIDSSPYGKYLSVFLFLNFI